ncbi:MAG: insulinase family protein [Rhodospirillales bacterium]
MSIDRLQAFYHLYYQPDNAVLMVAGRFDQNAALRQVAEFFGAMAKPARTLPILYTEEPEQDGERSVTVHRVGDNQLVVLAYHIPSLAHPDIAAISVLSDVLADTPRRTAAQVAGRVRQGGRGRRLDRHCFRPQPAGVLCDLAQQRFDRRDARFADP